MSELLPCPFCGGDLLEMDRETIQFDNQAERWFISCYSCSCQGVITYTKEDAIKAWNTRAKDKSPSNPLLDALAAETQELGFYDEPLPKENFDKFAGDL